MTPLQKLAYLRENSGHKPEFIEGRFQHCLERIAERFQITLDYDEWDRLNLAIFQDDPSVLWVDSGDTPASSVYRVTIRGQEMLVAWSETAFVMMTVFPRADIRLRHLRTKTYVVRAQSLEDLQYRDERRQIAERMADLVPDYAGRLVLPAPAPAIAAVEPVMKGAMADALVALQPKLSLVPAAPKVTSPPRELPPPVANGETAAMFALLQRHLTEQDEALRGEQAKADDELRQLEARLAVLRAGDPVLTMRRDIIAGTRAKVEEVFEGWRGGRFDDEAAASLASLFLAQQPEPATKNEAVISHGPGGRRQFTLNGKTRTLNEWAVSVGMKTPTLYQRVMNAGMSLEEALSKPVVPRGRTGPRAPAR